MEASKRAHQPSSSEAHLRRRRRARGRPGAKRRPSLLTGLGWWCLYYCVWWWCGSVAGRIGLYIGCRTARSSFLVGLSCFGVGRGRSPAADNQAQLVDPIVQFDRIQPSVAPWTHPGAPLLPSQQPRALAQSVPCPRSMPTLPAPPPCPLPSIDGSRVSLWLPESVWKGWVSLRPAAGSAAAIRPIDRFDAWQPERLYAARACCLNPRCLRPSRKIHQPTPHTACSIRTHNPRASRVPNFAAACNKRWPVIGHGFVPPDLTSRAERRGAKACRLASLLLLSLEIARDTPATEPARRRS